MKRILALILTLVMIITVLSGCMDPQNPSGNEGAQPQNPSSSEGTQNPADKSVSLSMTIAETLPSCPAFEENCFYAYDTEGNLYRVLWTDFSGLSEKDQIVVEYSDIKKLTYDEYPDGGWTPQYEITATHVTLERVVLASCLTYESGTYTLTLPQSGEKLKLSEEQERFVRYITDALVEVAEIAITQDIAEHSNNSGFYLQIDEDYLCLVVEVIKYLDEPDEICDDHEHLFYSERISSQAVTVESNLENGFRRSLVTYCVGEREISAISCMLWSKIDNGDGTFSETAIDKYDVVDLVSGKTSVSVASIPTIILDGAVTPLVPVNGIIESVSLLSENGTGFVKSDTTFEELSKLGYGTYYVVVNVLISGNCDPDAPQHSSRYEDVFRLEVKELIKDPTETGYENTVKLLQYAWDGYGITTKNISSTDVVYSIIDALKNMKETGETVEKISDDVLDKNGGALPGEFPVERGTMWIETDGSIYRLTPDLSQICRVDTHFGEGRVLEMNEAFKTDVNNAWYYAPYNYYKGTYQSGDDTVELNRVFISDSSVELRIKKIQIEKKYNPQNTITVELISTVDQTVAIKLHCQQSDDNFELGDGKMINLTKGVAETVDLTFGGWKDFRYWVYIEVDNTKAEIMIEP